MDFTPDYSIGFFDWISPLESCTTVSTFHECAIKMRFHLDALVIEKIKIVLIGKPLTGFGLICDLLFAMAFATKCNFTIVCCFRVVFPKMKWAEESPQIVFDLEALF